jgi:hypothetical protein
MNPTAKKILAGVVLLVSGAVIGFFGSRYLVERGRLALLHGDSRQFADKVLRHMTDDLSLTKEQQERVRVIVLNTAGAIDKIRQEQEPKLRELLEKNNAAINKLLTPEQQEKFSALVERLERRRKAMERFGPPPPPPGMEGLPPPPPGGPPPGMDGFPPPPPPPGMGPPPEFGHFPGFDGPPPQPPHNRDASPSASGKEQPATPEKTTPAPDKDKPTVPDKAPQTAPDTGIPVVPGKDKPAGADGKG